jgi:hypothetical protein
MYPNFALIYAVERVRPVSSRCGLQNFLAVMPFDGDVSRLRRGDRATIRLLAVKANASANL